jgi:chaperonin cofactor prefoldin
MVTQDKKKLTKEFYKLYVKMTTLHQKKRFIESQLKVTTKALEELSKTTEKKVYQIINSVLFEKNTQEVLEKI